MSLLLEALKRAELDFQKRKKASAREQVFNVQKSPSPEAQEPPETVNRQVAATLATSARKPISQAASQPPATPLPSAADFDSKSNRSYLSSTSESLDFPELSLLSVETPTDTPTPSIAPSLAPSTVATPAQAAAPITAPTDAVSQGVHPRKSPTPAPIPIAPATPRQALTAAGILAGAKLKNTSVSRRLSKKWLAFSAVVLALPLGAFLIWGDALFSAIDGSTASKFSVAQQGVGSVASSTSTAPIMASSLPAPSATDRGSAPSDAAAIPSKADLSTAESVAPILSTTVAPIFNTAPAARAPSPNTPKKLGTSNRPVHSATNTNSSSAIAQKTNPTESSNRVFVTASTAKPVSTMESAYVAYQEGNTEEASRLYREVLKNDPTQPDAWLGLAVIAHASNQRESAMNAYKRVLRLEPQNPTALAGMNSLNNKANEPRQESQLRELLARSPQEAELNHALGVVLSAEQRWSEAQPLFFKAHALSPQEPQYAYNLAVTLDHLRKPALAAQYYETALTLAKGKAGAFNESAARARLAALKTSSLPKSTP